jgi:hypothetical protein
MQALRFEIKEPGSLVTAKPAPGSSSWLRDPESRGVC